MERHSYKLEKRLTPSPVMVFIIPIISVLLALILGGIFLSMTGREPLAVYTIMFTDSLGSKYGLTETIVKAIPLALTALGVSLAFKMKLWNIGAEGQFYMGAMGASWLPLTFPTLPVYVMIPGMVVLGMTAGGLWALLTAIPRAIWKVNEIITTLMLNYIAILWVDYLVFGPWRDPLGSNFPITAAFSDAARLPGLGDSRIHSGLFFALAIAVILAIVFKYSRWGYSINVIGSSERAASYAGMNIKRNILLVMFLSGAISGLAGMAEVSGIIGKLQHGISPGYGYTAIIVAWLSKLNPLAILIVSVLFGALQVGGYAAQIEGVPAAVATMLQGMILFFVLGGEIFTNYRVRRVSRKGEESK